MAGFGRGLVPFGSEIVAVLVWLEKVEVWERVGLGWTGPRERRDRAKSGSEASRWIYSDLEVEACGVDLTEGPVGPLEGAGCKEEGPRGWVLAAVCAAGGARVGYCLAAAPAARDAFDDDDPIPIDAERLNPRSRAHKCRRILTMYQRDEVNQRVLRTVVPSRGGPAESARSSQRSK